MKASSRMAAQRRLSQAYRDTGHVLTVEDLGGMWKAKVVNLSTKVTWGGRYRDTYTDALSEGLTELARRGRLARGEKVRNERLNDSLHDQHDHGIAGRIIAGWFSKAPIPKGLLRGGGSTDRTSKRNQWRERWG